MMTFVTSQNTQNIVKATFGTTSIGFAEVNESWTILMCDDAFAEILDN